MEDSNFVYSNKLLYRMPTRHDKNEIRREGATKKINFRTKIKMYKELGIR